jgi:hypothetical protein
MPPSRRSPSLRAAVGRVPVWPSEDARAMQPSGGGSGGSGTSLALREKEGKPSRGGLQELGNLVLEGRQLYPDLCHLVGDRILRTADVTWALLGRKQQTTFTTRQVADQGAPQKGRSCFRRTQEPAVVGRQSALSSYRRKPRRRYLRAKTFFGFAGSAGMRAARSDRQARSTARRTSAPRPGRPAPVAPETKAHREEARKNGGCGDAEGT